MKKKFLDFIKTLFINLIIFIIMVMFLYLSLVLLEKLSNRCIKSKNKDVIDCYLIYD